VFAPFPESEESMTADQIRKFYACGDRTTAVLGEIAAQLADLNERLARLAVGHDVPFAKTAFEQAGTASVRTRTGSSVFRPKIQN
jgi:hypothetical protein